MAPQLATVDVALNAFYGYPMLSPTTTTLQNLKLRLEAGALTITGTDQNRPDQGKEVILFFSSGLTTPAYYPSHSS